jgi:hypothetical protein
MAATSAATSRIVRMIIVPRVCHQERIGTIPETSDPQAC